MIRLHNQFTRYIVVSNSEFAVSPVRKKVPADISRELSPRKAAALLYPSRPKSVRICSRTPGTTRCCDPAVTEPAFFLYLFLRDLRDI